MALFKIDGKLKAIKTIPFKLEKEIQDLTERDLDSILGLDFVKSEFSMNGFRLDTLAFDNETNAFVIIEYKRDKNFSVIDQGYAYLSLMLNNKADFILEYNEIKSKTLKRSDIDWSQSRVLFISTKFTNYQREAINFKDLPIELWEVKRYENNTISYEKIEKSGAQESIKTISKSDNEIDKVTSEIKVYSESDHLANVSDETKDLYDKLKSAILNFDNVEVKAKAKYIAFVAGSNFIDIHPQKKAVKIWLNLSKGDLDDPRGITRDVSATGHWGNGDYEIQITNDENIDYIMSLVKQSYKKNYK
jgi:predicted transport protein